MRLYIRRLEEEKIRKIKNWTLIYGRRKTGKSTLVKKNLQMDYYVLITDSNSAITADDKVIKIDDAIKEVKETLHKGGVWASSNFHEIVSNSQPLGFTRVTGKPVTPPPL